MSKADQYRGGPNELTLLGITSVAPNHPRMSVGDEIFRQEAFKHDYPLFWGTETWSDLLTASRDREVIRGESEINYHGKTTAKKASLGAITCLKKCTVYESYEERPNGRGLVYGEPVYLGVKPGELRSKGPEKVKVYILTQAQWDHHCGWKPGLSP